VAHRGADIQRDFFKKPYQRWFSGPRQRDGSKIARIKYAYFCGKKMITMEREQKYLQSAIRGKIADLLDDPVVSARVVLSGAKLGEKLCSITGMEGVFMFSPIPPGSYTLEVTYSGFSKLVQRGIAVRDHTITGLDLKMDFLEDSRTINLRAMSLEFFNDAPPDAEPPYPDLNLQLSEVMARLNLDRVLFNPPAALKIGCATTVEVGIYQNLKEEVMRRLLELNICRFDRDQFDVTLEAELQVAGCQVLPLGSPQDVIDGARYLDWKWEILPQLPGLGLMRLCLTARVRFAGFAERQKCLLVLDRDVVIRKNQWFAVRRFFKNRLA
jgi:hypothetical protein